MLGRIVCSGGTGWGKEYVGIAPGDMGLNSNALAEAGACSKCRFPGPSSADSLTQYVWGAQEAAF